MSESNFSGTLSNDGMSPAAQTTGQDHLSKQERHHLLILMTVEGIYLIEVTTFQFLG